MACEEDSWGLREYVASNVAVPEELRPQRVAVLCVGNRLMLDDGVGRHDDGGRFVVPFFLHALELHGKGVFRVDAGRDGYGAHAPGHAERRGACFGAEMPAVEQDVPNRQRLKIVGPCPQAATASMPRSSRRARRR